MIIKLEQQLQQKSHSQLVLQPVRITNRLWLGLKGCFSRESPTQQAVKFKNRSEWVAPAETMTLMLHWRLSIRCDEKFMRPRHTQNRSVQNSLASERREIYFRLRHTTPRSLLLCPGTRKLVYRYTARRNVAGINLCGRGGRAAPVSSISAAPTFAAAAQNFNSRARTTTQGSNSYLCMRVHRQSVWQNDNLATHNDWKHH